MVIAFAGLLINVAVAWSLSRDRQNVNTRAALLHVLGDLLGSVAAIAAGGIIWAGGPAIVDPLLSMFVGLLLLRATWKVLSESVRILLDGAPPGQSSAAGFQCRDRPAPAFSAHGNITCYLDTVGKTNSGDLSKS